MSREGANNVMGERPSGLLLVRLARFIQTCVVGRSVVNFGVNFKVAKTGEARDKAKDSVVGDCMDRMNIG